MWIASTNGFISIVQHRDQSDTLLVRARAVQDLQAFFDGSRILETKDADYRYHVLVKRQEMANILIKMIKNIDYPNFKNKISTVSDQRDKFPVYYKIWAVMKDYSNNLHETSASNKL